MECGSGSSNIRAYAYSSRMAGRTDGRRSLNGHLQPNRERGRLYARIGGRGDCDAGNEISVSVSCRKREYYARIPTADLMCVCAGGCCMVLRSTLRGNLNDPPYAYVKISDSCCVTHGQWRQLTPAHGTIDARTRTLLVVRLDKEGRARMETATLGHGLDIEIEIGAFQSRPLSLPSRPTFPFQFVLRIFEDFALCWVSPR